MFEKEAEEYAAKVEPFMDVGIDNSISVYHEEDVKQAFLAGAEFGYNKANEWHYVKDGDLPEDNKIVLFYTTYFDFWVGGIEPKNDKKHRWEVLPSVSSDYYAEDEVIAWKEIVLPKEE